MRASPIKASNYGIRSEGARALPVACLSGVSYLYGLMLDRRFPDNNLALTNTPWRTALDPQKLGWDPIVASGYAHMNLSDTIPYFKESPSATSVISALLLRLKGAASLRNFMICSSAIVPLCRFGE